MEKTLRKKLSKLAEFIAYPYTFIVVVLLCAIWAAEGYVKGYTDNWFKLTNSLLSLITFLIVFIVQFSEETESSAMQKKLDSIIKAFPEIEKGALEEEKKLQGQK